MSCSGHVQLETSGTGSAGTCSRCAARHSGAHGKVILASTEGILKSDAGGSGDARPSSPPPPNWLVSWRQLPCDCPLSRPLEVAERSAASAWLEVWLEEARPRGCCAEKWRAGWRKASTVAGANSRRPDKYAWHAAYVITYVELGGTR